MRAKCPSSDRGVYHLTLRRDSQLTELHNDLKTVCIQLLSRRRLIPNSGKRRVQRLDWRTPPPRRRRINNLQSCSQQDFRNPGLVVAKAQFEYSLYRATRSHGCSPATELGPMLVPSRSFEVPGRGCWLRARGCLADSSGRAMRRGFVFSARRIGTDCC